MYMQIVVSDVAVHPVMKYERLQQRRLEEASKTVLVHHFTHSAPVIELCQRYGHIRNAISFLHGLKVGCPDLFPYRMQ